MNRRHIWQIAPLVLLLTSLAWWAHAQSARGTPSTGDRDTLNLLRLGKLLIPPTDRLVRTGEVLVTKPGQHGERMLEQRTRTLVDEYRSSSDTGKRAIAKDDLTAVVNEHFALRQTSRQRELDELEKELNRLRALHERRQIQQDKIVADRVESLLREADGLGWGSSSSRRGGVPRGFQNTDEVAP